MCPDGRSAATMVVLTGCSGTETGETPAQPSTDHDLQLPAGYSGDGPGTLRTAIKLPIVDRRITRAAEVAARIDYVSTSGIDGSLQPVTGSVFEPLGEPPDGGWPVIVFGHGTVGIQSDCAPSLSPSLAGAAGAIRALLLLGYVLVMPDYQGLGTNTNYHPYLDATTAGYNMIDAARATRKLMPNASDKWVANELNATYSSPGLDLVGSVSVCRHPPISLGWSTSRRPVS